VNSENLHKARHIKKSQRMQEMSRSFVGRMQVCWSAAPRPGVSQGLDPVQVKISIAAVGYYLTKLHRSIVERDMMAARPLPPG
jgi:hypothetical protein